MNRRLKLNNLTEAWNSPQSHCHATGATVNRKDCVEDFQTMTSSKRDGDPRPSWEWRRGTYACKDGYREAHIRGTRLQPPGSHCVLKDAEYWWWSEAEADPWPHWALLFRLDLSISTFLLTLCLNLQIFVQTCLQQDQLHGLWGPGQNEHGGHPI